jgi:D-serine deaminase-like pyridoxal phosphate-dependent protein
LTSLDPNDVVLGDIETPALVIEAAALDANIERMQAAARAAGISLRPHAKTHKSPDIARRQRQAGAIGIGCATLREAEDMSAAGVSDVLITSPVVGRDKLGRVVALHRRSPSCWSSTIPRRWVPLQPRLAPTIYRFRSLSMWMSARREPGS